MSGKFILLVLHSVWLDICTYHIFGETVAVGGVKTLSGHGQTIGKGRCEGLRQTWLDHRIIGEEVAVSAVKVLFGYAHTILCKEKVAVGDVERGPTWPTKYTSVVEMASRAVKVVKGLASCRLSIWFTGTRVLSVSQNLSLDTRATASALARARTVGSEATLSVHHCVWAWGADSWAISC